MFAWVPTLQISKVCFHLFPWLHVHIGVSVGFFLGLAQQFQGLSGSIGSNPERRFLQETYRLESQDVLTGAASEWEARGIPTPRRWPHKEWNLTAKEQETQDWGQLETIFPIQATKQADSYRTSLQTGLEVSLCLNCISQDSWNNCGILIWTPRCCLFWGATIPQARATKGW